MVETETNDDGPAAASIHLRILPWIIANKFLFVLLAVVTLIALVPLYGVLFPPNIDLPEHILVSKLLWEKLTGVTNLDLEIPTFIGYKLSPYFLVAVRAFCQVFGIPYQYLPKIVVILHMTLNAVVIVPILYSALKDKNWRSYSFAFCFMLPAVVSMYSACWFMGFIGFSMAITLLIPAIFLTERFIRSGRSVDLFLVFIALFLIYTAHPFANFFWVIWCISRGLAALVTRSFALELKRMIMLGFAIGPIFAYHSWATAGTELSTGRQYLYNPPLLTAGKWYEHRVSQLLDGSLLRADFLSDARVFALFALGFVLITTFIAIRSKNQRARNLMLASTFFLLICSVINERFIPAPGVHWVAWDYRYSSTIYAVCIAVASFVLIRFLPLAADKLRYKIAFAILAAAAVVASASHLLDVRKAYARFDPPAREFMAKVFNGEEPKGIALPHGRWHPDGTLIKMYICLEQPDCNADGSTFKGIGGILYAVRIRKPATPPPAAQTQASAPAAQTAGPPNAFTGGNGSGRGQFESPRGITADGKGNFYVADSGNARIQKFDADGNFVSSIGTPGTSEGQLGAPNGVVVDGAGNIYVTDAAQGKILKFGPDGLFLKEWRGPDRGLYGPRDIAMGPNDQIYILDQGNARIVKFDTAAGEFTSWGGYGSSEGQFLEATGLTVGGGFVFVADNGNDRLQVFDLDGNFIRQWEIPVWGKFTWHYPDVALDEKSKILYVTNGLKQQLLAFDLDGNPIDPGLDPDGAAKFGNPSALFFSDTKTSRILYVLNTGSAKVNTFKIASAAAK